MSETLVADLKVARDRLVANIKAAELEFLANVSMHGKSVPKQSMIDSMYARLEKLNALINGLEPGETVVVGYSG